MNGVLAVVAAIAVLNPPRTRLGLPADDGRADLRRSFAGIVIGGLVLLGVGAGAGAVLDSLRISPETYRIAAGFVLVIVAGWMLFFPIPTDEPDPGGAWDLVWPVGFPRVVSPEMLTLALTMGASDGVGTLAASLAVALGSLGALAVVPTGPVMTRLLAAVGRVVAVVLVLVGIWLAIEGIREV